MATEREAAVAKRWTAGRQMLLGVLTLAVLIGGVGAWSAFASISGAVVASGKLKVESNRQVVQHLDGGIVSEIMVGEGEIVDAGEPLIRLDDKLLANELAIVEGELYEIMARRGRLTAEQNGADEIEFPAELREAAAESPDIMSLIKGQRSLFRARNETAAQEADQLRERQAQIREQIEGAKSQREALTRQLDFVGQELTDLRSLQAKGLAQASRVLSLERENARLLGQSGELKSTIARLKGEIAEIEIQLVGLGSTRREEAITQLRDIAYRENELIERRASLRETMDRLIVRAPRPGIVIGMEVHALRSVVKAADPILYIVPTGEKLVVEAKVATNDIDQIYPGQSARLRFSAFSMRTTPDVPGRVEKISPDAFTDDQTGRSYYNAELTMDAEGLSKLGDDLDLVAGMPVEAFITTGDRSPMSYFAKPLTDFFNRALREE